MQILYFFGGSWGNFLNVGVREKLEIGQDLLCPESLSGSGQHKGNPDPTTSLEKTRLYPIPGRSARPSPSSHEAPPPPQTNYKYSTRMTAWADTVACSTVLPNSVPTRTKNTLPISVLQVQAFRTQLRYSYCISDIGSGSGSIKKKTGFGSHMILQQFILLSQYLKMKIWHMKFGCKFSPV